MGSTRTVRIYEEDFLRIDQHSQLPGEASMGAKVNDVLNRLEESAKRRAGGVAGMSPLPLDDRILFACSRGARSGAELARKLKTDKPSVYSVLNRLVELELLVVDEDHAPVSMFETADAVEVDYGPRGIDVRVAGGPDPRRADDGRCTATTTRGSRCKRDAKGGSAYCGLHASDEAEMPARG